MDSVNVLIWVVAFIISWAVVLEPTNIEKIFGLLAEIPSMQPRGQLFATAKGLSASDESYIINKLGEYRFYPEHCAIRRDMACETFIQEYRQSLSLAEKSFN